MFQFKRNTVIVTVLVFMIAIAAYLSLTEQSSPLKTPDLADANALTTEETEIDPNFFDEYSVMETLPPDGDVAVSSEDVALTDEAAGDKVGQEEMQPAGSKEVIISKKSSPNQTADADTNKAVEVSFFAEEKMLREQTRAAEMEQLSEYIADPNLDKDSKAKAAENLLVIQDRIEKESSAESLLRAKGFKDVFVRMDDNTVDVVVNKSEALTDEEIAQIEEIVQRKTGYTVGQIKISCLKVNSETANK